MSSFLLGIIFADAIVYGHWVGAVLGVVVWAVGSFYRGYRKAA